mgnify:CR=1 FL=1
MSLTCKYGVAEQVHHGACRGADMKELRFSRGHCAGVCAAAAEQMQERCRSAGAEVQRVRGDIDAGHVK